MSIKFTQKDAEAKSLHSGVKMVGKYTGANKKVAHECVFCSGVFYPVAWDVWNQGIKRCKKCMYKGRKSNPQNKWSGTNDISGTYFSCIRKGAKCRNLSFEITIEQAQTVLESQNYCCALSGIPLVLVHSYNNNGNKQTASLDRIDSSKGYTIDNIQWIHKDLNTMKMSMTEQLFKTWIYRIFTHLKLGEL